LDNTIRKNEITVQDFEQTADMLIHVMFALTEKQHNTAANRNDAATLALEQASLSILAGIRSFALIEHLRGQ
jgi:hypothetical protein